MPPATPSPWRAVVGLGVALMVFLTTLLVAFGLPAVHTEPRDIPVAVVAPPGVVTTIEAGFDQAHPGAFDLRAVDTPDRAEEMIRDREVYGAFVLDQGSLTIDVAGAASVAVSQTVTAAGQALAAMLGIPATVNDVAPLPREDPRGVGLSAGALPIALGGLMAGAAITQILTGAWRRIGAMVTFAVSAGLAMTAVLHFWFGTLPGNYLLTSAAAALGILATGMTVLGLEQLLGRPGIGVGALLIVFLGNPLSGLTSAPEMLPHPWGTIGQTLPPGATGTLLRNIGLFDGAATTRPVLVLAGWLALGVITFWIGSRRSPTDVPDTESPDTGSGDSEAPDTPVAPAEG